MFLRIIKFINVLICLIMQLNYDRNNKKSVIDFAKKLKGKTLRIICDQGILTHTYKGKGDYGQLLEKYYFQYEPNSESEPDFKEIGLELKSTSLKQLRNKEYRSKERLVLNIINYIEVVAQNFDTSSFWKKNANILFVFYLHNRNQNLLDYVIKLIEEWHFPEKDLEIIKKDWKTITEKIIKGKAHELSEGDTFYLGACTKGGKGGNPRQQPYSKILAKQRAYSLKQGYVNHILASIANESSEIYGKLIKTTNEIKKKSLEEIVVAKFESYYGKTVNEIIGTLKIKLNVTAKSFYADLTKAVLGIELDKEIEEFEKAEVIVKTVRLKENDLPKEDISFPTFKYEKFVKEDWEDSGFKQILEHKFFFVFFQFQSDELILKKAKFWNMPFKDINEAQKVWERTKSIVMKGGIVKDLKGNIRYTNFPNKTFNSVSHVRPHAQNAADTYPLPIKDKVTNLTEFTKHSFWLNNSYIRDEIFYK
jgi:DNA mismatch repair protein MutH